MSIFSDKAKEKHRKMSDHLRTVRKDNGLTMRALSLRLGTPHSFIGKIENQDRRLDIAEFVLYCEGLEKDPIELFSEMVTQ
jgi:transcriptional regulator with XRE-family HTH domain